jgi:hypothetical protein
MTGMSEPIPSDNPYGAPKAFEAESRPKVAGGKNPLTPIVIVVVLGIFAGCFFVSTGRTPGIFAWVAYGLLVARAVREYNKKESVRAAAAAAERRRRRNS